MFKTAARAINRKRAQKIITGLSQGKTVSDIAIFAECSRSLVYYYKNRQYTNRYFNCYHCNEAISFQLHHGRYESTCRRCGTFIRIGQENRENELGSGRNKHGECTARPSSTLRRDLYIGHGIAPNDDGKSDDDKENGGTEGNPNRNTDENEILRECENILQQAISATFTEKGVFGDLKDDIWPGKGLRECSGSGSKDERAVCQSSATGYTGTGTDLLGPAPEFTEEDIEFFRSFHYGELPGEETEDREGFDTNAF